MLRRLGVKEIVLRATMFQATADYQKRQLHTQGILNAAARQARIFLNKEYDVTNDSLRIELSIKTDDRLRKHLTLGEKRIQTMAIDLVQNQQIDDDYLIITQDGQKVRPNEIYVRTAVLIDVKGNSVDRDVAWSKIYAFYKELARTGVIEQ